MTRNDIHDEYFEWLFSLVAENRPSSQISFRKLLMRLHYTEFTYTIPKDQNRAEDGMSLRYRFACAHPYIEDAELYLDGPCSMLEMMVALAFRCEEIMDNPEVGDRTGQWFWGMVTSLGLGGMTDRQFDREVVDDILRYFMRREYDRNGRGGLFTIRRCTRDLRDVEIWIQLCWYLDSIG